MVANSPQRPLLLKDLIKQVRVELTEAVYARIASDEPALFALKSIDLEVNFVIDQEESAEAGASAKLLAVVGLKAGVKQTLSNEQVQKVTLHLEPLKARPSPQEADHRVVIDSVVLPGVEVPGLLHVPRPGRPWHGIGELGVVRIKDFPGTGEEGITIDQLLERAQAFATSERLASIPAVSCQQLSRLPGRNDI